MVSAIFNPAASKSKLVAGVTPRRLWGRREASVPLSLSICLSMCLLPDAAPAPAGGNLDVGRAGSCASMASAAGSSVFGGSSAASFARRASSSASRSVTSGPSASGTSYHSCLSTQQQQPQVLDGACSQLEQAWVQTELAVRVFPAETSFKAVRTFRCVVACWFVCAHQADTLGPPACMCSMPPNRGVPARAHHCGSAACMCVHTQVPGRVLAGAAARGARRDAGAGAAGARCCGRRGSAGVHDTMRPRVLAGAAAVLRRDARISEGLVEQLL